jgi:hypothetical protein
MTGEDQGSSRDRVPAGDEQPFPGSGTVTRGDILRHDRFLRRILDLLRLDRLGGWLRLILVIVVPLALLGFVTWREGCFEWGSVKGPASVIEGVSFTVRGMSFLGDTMVWPYVILIPLLFVLLELAICRFEELFRSIRSVLSPDWLANHAEEYRAMVGESRRIVGGAGGWRTVRRAAVALGFFFFVYNTVTCTFLMPDFFKPYKSSSPFVKQRVTSTPQYLQISLDQKHALNFALTDRPKTEESSMPLVVPAGASVEGSIAPPPPRYLQTRLIKEVAVPKWDTEPSLRWWSWLSARLWVLLLGYVWIPLVLYKLANLVAATYTFTNRLAACPGALVVQPLDAAGGLGRLASLPIALTYPMVIFGIMLAMVFFKENTSASLHDLILLVPFLPVYFAMFFVPLLGVHRAMLAAKQEYQQKFAGLFEVAHEDFLSEVRNPTLDAAGFSRLQLKMKGLSESYERISAMPVWPFEMSTVYRLITAVLLPIVVPWVINYTLGHLLK